MTDIIPTQHFNSQEHRRQIATTVNRVLDGKINSISTVTLTASVASTTISDFRVSINSVILFMPTTANAAAEIGNGTMFVSTRTAGTSFVITHANNAQNDRTFAYAILG